MSNCKHNRRHTSDLRKAKIVLNILTSLLQNLLQERLNVNLRSCFPLKIQIYLRIQTKGKIRFCSHHKTNICNQLHFESLLKQISKERRSLKVFRIVLTFYIHVWWQYFWFIDFDYPTFNKLTSFHFNSLQYWTFPMKRTKYLRPVSCISIKLGPNWRHIWEIGFISRCAEILAFFYRDAT